MHSTAGDVVVTVGDADVVVGTALVVVGCALVVVGTALVVVGSALVVVGTALVVVGSAPGVVGVDASLTQMMTWLRPCSWSGCTGLWLGLSYVTPALGSTWVSYTVADFRTVRVKTLPEGAAPNVYVVPRPCSTFQQEP